MEEETAWAFFCYSSARVSRSLLLPRPLISRREILRHEPTREIRWEGGGGGKTAPSRFVGIFNRRKFRNVVPLVFYMKD